MTLSPTQQALRLTAVGAAQLKATAEAWIASDYGRNMKAWLDYLATLPPDSTHGYMGGCPQWAA
jgi:hypothetical protein